jgi:PST family polysaccharide transporter
MNFVKNVIWSFGGTVGVQLIGLVTNIILARALTPEIFGVVSLALVLIVLIHIIQEAGLSSVLIQRKTINKAIIATTFYLNIFLSLLFSVLLIIFATNIAMFFGHPEIEEILYYSVIGIIIGSLGVTFRGILTRRRQFKTITIINLTSELLGVVLTFIFLYTGEYFLAVGIRIIARPAFQAILLAISCKFNEIIGRPQISLLKEILPFSSSVLGIKTLNYTKNNIDYLFIGKLLGSQSLGLYTLAFQWSTIAKFYIAGSVAKVLFPEISKSQHDIERVKRLFINVVSQVSFFIFPFCIGLVLIAPEFIHVIYGSHWGDAVPILQILMIAGLLTSMGTVVSNVFQGLGRPGIELRVTTISIFMFIPLLLVGALFGLIGISFAVLIHAVVFDSILILKALRLLNIPFINIINSLKPVCYSMLSTTGGYYLIKHLFFSETYTLTTFALLILMLISLYAIFSYLFNKPTITRVYKQSMRIVKVRKKERVS